MTQFADLNPWLAGHPTQWRKDPPRASPPEPSACETRSEAPLQSPAWDQALNLAFCNWLGFVEQGLRYSFDGDPRVFVRKVFGIAGSDSHGDFNYTTSTKAALATMFAGWDYASLVGMVEDAASVVGVLVDAHPILALIVAATTGKWFGGLRATTSAHLSTAVSDIYAKAGPSLFSAAFGAARTLGLVDPEDVLAGGDPAELAVAALRGGRSVFGDGPVPFFVMDAQPIFDAHAGAAGIRGRYDDAWSEDDERAVDGTCLPDSGGDALLAAIDKRLSPDGRIGGRGTFDAEGTVLVPILSRLGLDQSPPVLRFRIAHGDGHGSRVTAARLWRVRKERRPEIVELDVGAGDLNGRACYRPLWPDIDAAAFGETSLPVEAVVMEVHAQDDAGPNGREEVYRGVTNPIWIAPVRVDRRVATVTTRDDRSVALTELEIVLDFPFSMGGVARAELHALGSDGKSEVAVAGELVVDPTERDSPLVPTVPGGRIVLRLPPEHAVPLDALADYDVLTHEERKDHRSFVLIVAAPFDAMGAPGGPGEDERLRNTFNDLAIPIRLEIGSPGVVYIDLPSRDVPPGGPLRLADPDTGELVIEDLLAPLTELDPAFGEHPVASALACDPASNFIAALVPRGGGPRAELCLYRHASGWECTGRVFDGTLEEGIRRIGVSEDEAEDPARPGVMSRRLTVAVLTAERNVTVRRFFPNRGRDPAVDPEPDVAVITTAWEERGLAMTPDGQTLLTLDARPDDPTDPTSVTGLAEGAAVSVSPPGGTAEAGLDVYRWDGTDDEHAPSAGVLLTPDKVTLRVTVSGITVTVGELPPVFWDPSATARGSFLATSDVDAWADYLLAAPEAFSTPGATPDLAALARTYGFDVFERPLAGGPAANLTPATKLVFPDLSGEQRGLKTCPALTGGGERLLFTAGALIPGASSPATAEVQWDLFSGPVGGPFTALTRGVRGRYLCGCWLR